MENKTTLEGGTEVLNKAHISRSCFWWHHWGKWKTYTASMTHIKYGGYFTETRQRRECECCGKIQDEYVSG